MSMDRKTLVAVVLCLALFFAYPFILRFTGLDRYLRPAQAPVAPPDTSAVLEQAGPGDTTIGRSSVAAKSPTDTAPPSGIQAGAASETAVAERVVEVETPLYRARFTNRGARLLSVQLKRYAAAQGAGRASARPALRPGEEVPEDARVMLEGGPTFGVDLGSDADRMSLERVVFDVAESLDTGGAVRTLTFTTQVPGGPRLRQTYRIRPDDYAIDFEVEVGNVPPGWRSGEYTLTTRSWPLAHESNPVDEVQSLKATSLVGTNLHREGMGGLRKGLRRFEGNALWTAAQTRYFSAAVAIQQGTARSAEASVTTRSLSPLIRARLGPEASPVQELAVSSLVVSLPGGAADRFLLYFGPNEYLRLARLGHGLERLVELGWSWIIPFSKLLLRLLVWLDGLIHNYGLAIIVLATLVRVLLHPLSMMSIKSMRAMQKVQPEMERIRAKYGKDPQAMNTAMMALYKEHKINPAGGCLPMVVQMPLFIALYSVLFNAIELRQAPFVAWMTDLSAPDVLFHVGGFPIRLLPILMAGSGLIQQMATPTDPRQANTFYLMNVVMVVFFYNLPSGLVLYWTVMNVLTALQQWIALHEDGTAPAAAASQVTGRGGKK